MMNDRYKIKDIIREPVSTVGYPRNLFVALHPRKWYNRYFHRYHKHFIEGEKSEYVEKTP